MDIHYFLMKLIQKQLTKPINLKIKAYIIYYMDLAPAAGLVKTFIISLIIFRFQYVHNS